MTQRKKWSELTPGQQDAIEIAAIVQIKLLIMALWDIWHRPEEKINGDRHQRHHGGVHAA